MTVEIFVVSGMVTFARLFGGVATQQAPITSIRASQLFSVVTLGAITSSFFISSAQAVPKKKPLLRRVREALSYPSQTSIPDGVYLQGESSQPQQIGRSYAIFEVRQERVVGAFYQPSSSFDCFYGTSGGERLALNVVDSYSQQSFPYTIAVDHTNLVVATGSVSAQPRLDGFYPIDEISQSDREILASCQTNLTANRAR